MDLIFFIQQMFFVSKHSGRCFMLVNVAAAADTKDSYLCRWRDEIGFGFFSVGVQTPTE